MIPLPPASSGAAQDRVGLVSLVTVPSGGLRLLGTPGGDVSILNGPRWTVPVQLPASSTVARWKYQSPLKVAVNVPPVQVSSAILVWVGVQEGF